MKIAVLSGKGGTGKTLVAVNLANVILKAGYVDCDVEEPNGRIYYPGESNDSLVYKEIPKVNQETCIKCGKCSEFCRFNALALILDKIRVFEQLCHSCGGCKIICPVDAIYYEQKSIGSVSKSVYKDHEIISGKLNIGEETGVLVIEAALKEASMIPDDLIIDCPPGNGCSVMASIQEADYCILVAEPSIFGLHNLKMVYELIKIFNIKSGIVINKSIGNDLIKDFALSNNIEVLEEIPFDKELALLNSNGVIVSDFPRYNEMFMRISKKILRDQ